MMPLCEYIRSTSAVVTGTQTHHNLEKSDHWPQTVELWEGVNGWLVFIWVKVLTFDHCEVLFQLGFW